MLEVLLERLQICLSMLEIMLSEFGEISLFLSLFIDSIIISLMKEERENCKVQKSWLKCSTVII